MGVWSWTKDVITETGGGFEPIPVGLERNPGSVVEMGARNAPGVPLYMLRVGMRSGFGQTEAQLPVFRRPNDSPHPILKEIYFCEVAGQMLEAANVFALRQKVQRTLEAIAPAHKLPLCYLRAPRFDYALPVYEEGSHLICPVLTGPKIKGDELAELREPVVRWLRTAGYLMEEEEPLIQVVRPSDLRLVPPAAVLRCIDDESLWMPTVEGTSSEGAVVGLLAQPAQLQPARRGRTRAHTPPAGADVTALLRTVGQALTVGGHLASPGALYASDVRAEIWARTEELTDTTNRLLEGRLDGGTELRAPIRHTAAGEVVVALREHGITVFLAGDDATLAAVVGRYLVDAGFLGHADDLRLETARSAPAEALDPDAIWRRGDDEVLSTPAVADASQDLSTTDNEDQEVKRS